MRDQTEEHQQIIAGCWEDNIFKPRLKADPLVTLPRAGLLISRWMTAQVLENTEQVMHLVIPTKPTVRADALLEDAVGAKWICHARSAGDWICSHRQIARRSSCHWQRPAISTSCQTLFCRYSNKTHSNSAMNDKANQYQQIIAKCWADTAFKQQLISNPVSTLKQEGIDVPEGLSMTVLENSDTLMNLVIPVKPDELSDEQLEGAAGGYYCEYCL